MQVRERYITPEIQEGEWILPARLLKLEEIKEILPRLADTYTPTRFTEELDANFIIISYSTRALWAKLLSSLKKRELQKLVAFSHSIETDPDRLQRLRELAGEGRYVCHIVWLVNMPFDSLPNEYKEIELELYKLARYNADIHVLILDSTRYPATVTDLMRALEIDTLPALVISADPMNLKEPRKENTIIFSSGALKRLVNQGKVREILNNIPNWARMGILKNKVRLEGEVKSLLAEFWNEIKGLISVNIS